MPKISVVRHSVCLDRCSSFRRGCLEYVSSLTCRSHNCIGCVGLPAAIGAGLMRYRCCVFESLSRTMMQVPTRRLCSMIGSLRVDFIGNICRSGVSAQVVSARAPVPSASAALICAVDGRSVVEEGRGQPARWPHRSEAALATDHGRGRLVAVSPTTWHACHDAATLRRRRRAAGAQPPRAAGVCFEAFACLAGPHHVRVFKQQRAGDMNPFDEARTESSYSMVSAMDSHTPPHLHRHQRSHPTTRTLTTTHASLAAPRPHRTASRSIGTAAT